jgi:hypothetical protein
VRQDGAEGERIPATMLDLKIEGGAPSQGVQAASKIWKSQIFWSLQKDAAPPVP